LQRDGGEPDHDLIIRLQGPDIPDAIPSHIAEPQTVAETVAFRARYTLTIDAPRRVLEICWTPGSRDGLRILVFSRGDWETALSVQEPLDETMTGTSWRRLQGVQDALLNRVLTDNGYAEVPLNKSRTGDTLALYQRPRQLTAERDGPVTGERSQKTPGQHVDMIRAKADELNVTKVGIIDLRPEFIEIGTRLDHKWVIGLVNQEDYSNVLGGAAAVERGAHDAYKRCAESATDLARYIREVLGYPALAHHNGGCEIQGLPMLYHAGIGELGRHGSLINPDIGAFWRPGFVSTDLPLLPDAPIEFGVQDYCLTCRLCETACPGDAVSPADDYIVTDGIKRWLIDNEKCFPYSRLREDYCHICVDVCPYIHKENGDAAAKGIFKEYLAQRKKTGLSAPK